MALFRWVVFMVLIWITPSYFLNIAAPVRTYNRDTLIGLSSPFIVDFMTAKSVTENHILKQRPRRRGKRGGVHCHTARALQVTASLCITSPVLPSINDSPLSLSR